ncbi:50S ribosomal protein L18 [Vulcaniibacterium thermophilum]|uniref:Large ribosomal subunit protein uL18 n=2 Tax=Vulcaniibacterium thermophilum TaxID=1169913 RepID=A0A918ZBG2_9GAMM|nr:50S ribosomal protein L18 [Vulcaniibacterium thermophilum]
MHPDRRDDPLPICENTTMEKKTARLRRAKSTRLHIRELGVPRLSVLRTGQHLYAQVFTADGSRVIAAASTTQAELREGLKSGKNLEAAAKVGRAIAEKAKAAGVEKVAFDRSGYRYHGRIKALADAAREAGLQF